MTHVGLVTFHHVPNMGAFWQTWSMVQILRRMNCDVSVINYQPRGHQLKFRRTGIRAIIPSLGRIRMKSFMLRHLPLTAEFHTYEETAAHVNNAQYDALVTGSDQVWMADDYLGFDPVYHLDLGDPSKCKRIAYAPSCGTMASYGQHSQAATRCLSNFHALSVRDLYSMNVVKELGFDRTTLVVDPTLLAEFNQIVRCAQRTQPYVLVVGKMNHNSARLARDMADLMHLRLVAAATQCETADEIHRFVHPGEWLNYIANAQLIITSLFHGAAISISLRRAFIAIDTAGRSFKLKDLLQRFGLEDRFLSANSDGIYPVSSELSTMNYESVEDHIQNEVQDSLQYLRGALHG